MPNPNKGKFIKQPWHAKALKLYKSGMSVREVATEVDMGRDVVQRVVKHHGIQRTNKDALRLKAGPKRTPNILLFDLETSPMLSWHWRVWKENIRPHQIVQYSHVLCWAAKWLDQKTIMFDSMQKDKTDERICKTLWDLFDRADSVIAHNGKAFDTAMMNARWANYGMGEPSAYKTIDTLQIARKTFNIPHKSLEGILDYFDMGGKLSHEGFGLWLKCMDGNRKAWKHMEAYNVEDVFKLEEVYRLIRPFAKRHPNVALWHNDTKLRCICCGHEINEAKHQIKSNDAYTSLSCFDSFRCPKCKKVMRSGKRKDVKALLRHAL